MKNAGRVSEWLEEMGLPYVSGRTWTSDAIYRETKANVDKRKAEGCIAVEMECASMQAVCDFRGLDLYYYLISGDLLDCEEWDMRILGDDEEKKHQLKNFYIALEMTVPEDLDGIWEVYHSWMDSHLSDYNTDLYYQARDYIAACYKAGEIL